MVPLLVPALRDERLDVPPQQPPPDPRVAVPLVPGQAPRPPSGPARPPRHADRVLDPLELRRFVPLPGRYLSREGRASTIND